MPQKRESQVLEAPQLPTQLAPRWIDEGEIGDHFVVAEALVDSLDAHSCEAEDVSFDRAVLKRVDLGESQLRLLQLLDVRLEGCDLASARWEKAHIQRAELLSCRLVGFSLLDAQCDNMLIQRCNAEAGRFWNTSFRASRFEHCSLKAASFENSDLSGVLFHKCDLREADLRRAKLKGADIRGCQIDGAQIGVSELKGLIVSPAQAVELASLFGVVVRAEEGETGSVD